MSNPRRFATPISAAQILDLYDRRPIHAGNFLTAMSMGAPEQFLAAVIGPSNASSEQSLQSAWQDTRQYPLTEPQAIGWATVGVFSYGYTWPLNRVPIQWWVDRFGPDAYLYVLAGIGEDEAVAMQTAGTSPTNEQLQVMVALNGVTLPTGI